MSKILNNERGMIDILLIVVLVAVMVAGGFVVYQNRKANAEKATETTVTVKKTASKTATPIADPYAGWKTVNMPKYKNVSVKYPTDWTLSKSEDTVDDFTKYVIKITSPSGFIVYFDNYLDGSVGDCQGVCKRFSQDPVTFIGTPAYEDIITFDAQGNSDTYLGLTSQKDCDFMCRTAFTGEPNKIGFNAWGYYPDSGKQITNNVYDAKYVDPAVFTKDPSVAQAKLILASFTN